ncbi:hypothetical protein HAZT_HAZT009720 [Hyalella azteca]|uniref:cystathionine gamma-lyase n=1 Tax=Hyalella azteca TaxID=294128 RepID=A0A6A0GRU3_HYAAZ|nr:hypothetical protein HAZT_HAZT009720 [Hyalella azteca]
MHCSFTAVTFASGTAAISSVMQLLRAGDHVLVSHHLYSGTWTFLTKIAARQGLVVEFIDMRQASEVAAALKPSTRIVWFESPSNPTMDLVDIAAVATIVQQHNQRVGLEHLSLEQPNMGKYITSCRIADKRNELDVEARAILVVDNTFMTGVLQRPLLLGADLVVHSCTKYINGSTDVIMGVVCTSSKNLHEKLKFIQTASGAIPSPFDCYLVQRSVRTLPLRMERHMKNGIAVAKFLESHACVRRVNHPGLPSHPQHKLSVRQSFGHSGMLSFYLREDDIEKSKTFLKSLAVVTLSSSLGSIESLAELPVTMSHAGVPAEEREASGVTAGLIRLSQYEYSRSGNPTRDCLEKCLASLEEAQFGLVFASGLAATTTVMHLLSAGDHFITMDDLYGGTNRYFRKIVARQGISVDFVDTTKLELIPPLLKNNTKLIWLETPTNPTLKVTDIAAVVKIAKDFNKDIIVVVDNTFLSPYFQRPLTLGADLVLHSCTKYLNGHTDVVMGAVCTSNNELHDRLRFLQNAIGGVPSPFDCYLVNRSLKTLALAKRQCYGHSGMITVYIKGDDINITKKFFESLKLFTLAESLGGYESLCELPSLMTHASVSAEERAKLGITDSLVRLSVGLEDTQELISDLDQALKAAVSPHLITLQ